MKPDFFRIYIILASQHVADQEAQSNNDHNHHQRNDDLGGAISGFRFGILRAWEAGDQTLGKSLNDDEGKHGCGDLVHGFHEKARTQYGRYDALSGLHQVGGNKRRTAG